MRRNVWRRNQRFRSRPRQQSATASPRFIPDAASQPGDVFRGRWLTDRGAQSGTHFGVILPPELPPPFEDLKIPLKIAATDYFEQSTTVFETGQLLPAMTASSAIPAVFLPVEFRGHFYIDGSATNPCPLDLVQSMTDHVVAVDVSGGTQGQAFGRPHKIDAVYASNQLMQMSIVKHTVAKFPETLLLRPPVDTFRSLDFLHARQILEETKPLREKAKVEIGRLLGGPATDTLIEST